MIKSHPPSNNFYSLPGYSLRGYCPHCKTGTTFTRTTNIETGIIQNKKINRIVINYNCDVCLGHLPIFWELNPSSSPITAKDHKEIIPVREPFNLDHVPPEVVKEINEGLDCLSVAAYHGFATLCRRTVQAICTNIGTKASSKVEKQIDDMIELTDLRDKDEWRNLAKQIMLSGHDGAHPELPEMNAHRAAVLLQLLQDLTYELYTRKGKIQQAATLRQDAISKKKNQT